MIDVCYVFKFCALLVLCLLGLPHSKLGAYLENRVNTFLRKKDSGAGDVAIRVLSSTDKVTEVKPGMKARLVYGLDIDSFKTPCLVILNCQQIREMWIAT